MCRNDTDRKHSPQDDGSSRPTDDQRREWRRWIVEAVRSADYGVVPLDHLVDLICEREPDDIDRSAVRAALTETVLPRVDRETALDYDADRELLIDYGN